MKEKLSSNNYFLKVRKDYLKLGIYEAYVLAYVEEFQSNGLPCFASRAHIAAELHMSESTVQRTIKNLTDLGYLNVMHEGMKRTIVISDKGGLLDSERGSIRTPKGVYLTPERGSKRINTKIHTTKINYKDNIQTSSDSNVEDLDTERINKAAARFGLKKSF